MSRDTLPFQWTPDPAAQVWVWDDAAGTGAWARYEPGVNSAPRGRWGPEAEMIRAFRRDHPGAPLAIIKYAPGQTGVARDPARRDWNLHSRGEAWDHLVAITDPALKSCGLHLDAVFWIGNHNDGMRADQAAAVPVDMRELVDASRARWGADVPWIVGLPDDTAPYSAQVRQALAALDDQDARMVSFETADYGVQADGLHYDAPSVVRLGREFYLAWRRSSPDR